MANHLYYGDNLDILRSSIPDESVDLIYLGPKPVFGAGPGAERGGAGGRGGPGVGPRGPR